jgi:hypothetical protein
MGEAMPDQENDTALDTPFMSELVSGATIAKDTRPGVVQGGRIVMISPLPTPQSLAPSLEAPPLSRIRDLLYCPVGRVTF